MDRRRSLASRFPAAADGLAGPRSAAMKEHRISGSGGLTLYAREWGEPDAPTVVLVHGYPDTCEVWNPLLPYLTDRYHVVAYDVRGAGRSGPGWSYGGYELDRL